MESQLNDSLIERRVIEAVPPDRTGQRIEFVGLQASITDVLVRVSRLDGSVSTSLVHPTHPWIDLVATPGAFAVAATFLRYGMEHILGGVDHLLFVLGLLLLVRNGWSLLQTITAFTVAHSVTLTLAATSTVRFPGPPIEATIALSILLLAVEIARRNDAAPSFTVRWPWIAALVFGLLHGFGFAGALSQIGLPPRDLPLALLTFNVGVEIGQLLFIALVLGLRAGVLRCRPTPLALVYSHRLVTYALGSLAACWVIERTALFWS